MRPSLLALLLAALPLAGCASQAPQRVFVEGLFGESEATYRNASAEGPGRYEVNVHGRLWNREPGEMRNLRVVLGIAGECGAEPELPGFLDVGNLAGGARANFQGTFEQTGPLLVHARLFYKVLRGEREVLDQGCGTIPVGFPA
jgi:hypothetical protein